MSQPAQPSVGPLGMPIPPGVGENDPRPVANRPETIYAIVIVLGSLAWMGGCFRLITRIFITKCPGADDAFIVVTLVFFTVLCAGVGRGPTYGLGQHTAFLDGYELSMLTYCQYLFGLGYCVSVGTIKISLLFQFLRVFKKTTWKWWFTVVLLVITCSWTCTMAFVTTFPCLPRPDAWWTGTMTGCYLIAAPDKSIAVNFILGHGASNVVLDTFVFSLAFTLQFETDVPAKRLAARALFLVGACSWGLAIGRLVETVESKGAGVGFDPAFGEPTVFLLSVGEVCLANLYSTIPFFWPVIEAFNEIFVKYEFNVSVESRWPAADDEIELARTRSGSGGGATSASGKYDTAVSISDVNGLNNPSPHSNQHYQDPYTRDQVTIPGGANHDPLSGTIATAYPVSSGDSKAR